MSAIRILLVDDDFSFLQTVSEYLRKSLLAIVYTAASVPAAIAEVDERGPFDVVISDFSMPPHTARDLENHLRQSQNFTPLLLHSGQPEVDDSGFHAASYLGFIPKPGNREVIDAILKHFPHAKKS